ncbi:hypothetical protein COJ27_29835 [Bacillus cereus]|uniref:nucleotidyltransferase family protein n=1 Tax=Bacillus cereus TaxID=1396 RepID=UPI000BF31DD7|nr:nucleotidyltransferase family protein [Bacillus cereus]PFL57204.1 hypothetical protein COJ27_29835 [Bacillus cereus]
MEKVTLEQELVLLLSKLELIEDEVKYVSDLLNQDLDWSRVVGLLHFHRIVGNAFCTLKKYNLLNRNKMKYGYLVKILGLVYNAQLHRGEEQLKSVLNICELLNKEKIDYVILKGIVLSNSVYRDMGVRVFNDCDILVKSDQLQQVSTLLKSQGYIQGEFCHAVNEIKPAKRREIIQQPLISHELLPFEKKSDSQFIESHIVDVQFSIDLRTNTRTDDIVNKMIEKSQNVLIKDVPVRTLSWDDTLLFLCIHFYKEAISYEEIEGYRDILLYKILDIYKLLGNNYIKIDWYNFYKITNEYDQNKAVYYAFYILDNIYPNILPDGCLEKIKPKSTEFVSYVIDKDKNTWVWQDEISQRLFTINKLVNLEMLNDMRVNNNGN